MSTDMKSQNSEESDYSDQSDDMEDDDDDEYQDLHDYYNETDDLDLEKPKKCDDPEYFEYELLQMEDVDRLLNEEIEALCTPLKITPSLAKMLLLTHDWRREYILDRHQKDPAQLLVDSKIRSSKKYDEMISGSSHVCRVCVCPSPRENFHALNCGHAFCADCWDMHFQVQIKQGVTIGIECMGKDCPVLVPEDFLCSILSDTTLRDKYSMLSFNDLVKNHPQLRFCPGANCSVIVRAKEALAKKVQCSQCNSSFCFRCGNEYHAPTDCETIKRWLTKCADDSETANYISAHTKDCPKCHVCIEKNGGCNHMQCSKCKYDFCWMCLGDWKAHGSEYYECSRYKENPNIANESVLVQAREALKKYLFYYERWENHAKSLKLEEQTLMKIRSRIQDKVMTNEGTWIDWQYLLDAATLLKKCRYTLQYTYPYAYYMDKGGRKQLFEYQQAQLEAEVENLSWKVERAEITDRGDLENQMDIAEKRRLTLLKDFLHVA